MILDLKSQQVASDNKIKRLEFLNKWQKYKFIINRKVT